MADGVEAAEAGAGNGSNRNSYGCVVAQTALVVPFHWGDSGRAPGEKSQLARYLLMDKLLQRSVVHPETGQRMFLWELNRNLPFEIGELAAYLKHILGWDDTVKYMSEHRKAKEMAFGFRFGPRGMASSMTAAAAATATAAATAAAAAAAKRGDGDENARRQINGEEQELMDEVMHGEDTKPFEDMEVWKCQRLVMNDEVRRLLFSQTQLWACADADKIPIDSLGNALGDPQLTNLGHGDFSFLLRGKEKGKKDQEDPSQRLMHCRIDVTRVELVLYPRDTALLIYHIDWRPEPTSPFTLDQLRTWLFMAKFKNKVRGMFSGWSLGRMEAPSSPHFATHADSLGKLAQSLYGERRLSLSCIGNWIIHLPHENPMHPPHRISYSAAANHHTVVVIDKQPTKKDLRKYLGYLTRAFNVNSLASDMLISDSSSHHSLQHILPHRRNRYIGVSFEGSVALSWVSEESNRQYECVTWPKVFQGVYFILDVHARGEAGVLTELSRMSAKVAEHLHLNSLEKLEKERLKLRTVAMQMIKYSLALSSDVCNGMSEYSQYFTTLRKALGVPDVKQKIREEIEHVLTIVESVYLEEQRRKKRQEKKRSKQKELDQRRRETWQEARRQRFETLISIGGTITLPLVLVGGIMGMNLSDLPDPSFWHLLGYTALTSFVLFLLLVLWYVKLYDLVFGRFWAREMRRWNLHPNGDTYVRVEEVENDDPPKDDYDTDSFKEDEYDSGVGDYTASSLRSDSASDPAHSTEKTSLLWRG